MKKLLLLISVCMFCVSRIDGMWQKGMTNAASMTLPVPMWQIPENDISWTIPHLVISAYPNYHDNVVEALKEYEGIAEKFKNADGSKEEERIKWLAYLHAINAIAELKQELGKDYPCSPPLPISQELKDRMLQNKK